MRTATPLIELKQLSKRYRRNADLALNSLSLGVAAGSAYGLLGANGAGKTTAIRLLLNFLQPTSGTATICGLDVMKNSVEVKGHIGYLAGDVALYGTLTGNQLLDYLAALTKVDRAYRQQLSDMFDANLTQPIRELSRGNRQKIGIIQAFMHQPDVIILDEPTSGLDPLMQEAFYALIHATKQRGAAVFMSSHNFSEVERVCDKIGIIRKGQLIKEQMLSELSPGSQQRFTVTFAVEPPLTNLSSVPHVTVAGQNGKQVRLIVEGDLSPLFGFLGKHRVTHFTCQTADLEQEFLQYYDEDEKA